MQKSKLTTKSRVSVSDQLKVLYFKRLAEYDPEEVLGELKKYSWPPMKVLEVCQQFNVELAIAYINERLGRSMDALEVFKVRFLR